MNKRDIIKFLKDEIKEIDRKESLIFLEQEKLCTFDKEIDRERIETIESYLDEDEWILDDIENKINWVIDWIRKHELNCKYTKNSVIIDV